MSRKCTKAVRKMPFTGELAWIPKEMRPIAELCSGEQAHLFVRGLTLCHMDAILRRHEEAQRFLAGDIEDELALRGVDVIVHKPDRKSTRLNSSHGSISYAVFCLKKKKKKK